MFKIFRNKKGVSPLVATIFLMAFAVGLGAVVMQFSEGLVGGQKDSACSADFNLVITSICTKGNNLEFTTENYGKTDVNGIKIEIVDMAGKLSGELIETIIAKDGKVSKKIKYSGKIQGVQFIALVKEGIAKDAKVSECNLRSVTFNKDQINSC